MEVTALCIKLLMIVMMLLCEHDQLVYAASLHIDPNKAQFFEYESVTFNCEGVSYCEVVNASNGKIPSCNVTNERTATGSSCTIDRVYPADSGKYWFEAEGGERSNSVNIIVTDGSVILEIPALPVMEGEDVTLTCRNKMTSSQTSAHFYNYDILISNSSTGYMTIHSVSTSDEGLYKCSISGAGESAESRLIVRDSEKETVTTSFKDTSTTSSKEMVTFSSTSNPWIIVKVLLLLLLICVGLLHFVKSYWHRVMFYVSTLRSGSGSAGNQTVSENFDSTSTAAYAVVTKKKKKKDEDESSCRAVYYMLSLDGGSQQLEPTVSPALVRTQPTFKENDLYSTIQQVSERDE
ncbi:low affinity immunoglobulin gamma Fc region receptor III-like [Anabas testudineus]|uniref:low affinity immunoglobulin gamma Fc region receptor III-like n=1 Tax=Anabas testudineus TaxID=64144 RepID=UPI000E454ACF|nr:low affinity immunoglobulin gamma Fc region receptor III-like [Anabas testudineus]